MNELPVDPKLGISAAQALAWKYRQETSADLNGDGPSETIVLAANVELSPDGVPLWEDAHRWALIVAERAEATLVFSAFVPNGFAEAAVLEPDAGGARGLVVQQRTPADLRTFAIAYEGPGKARSVSSAYYRIEKWLPGGASLSR